jgi:hypothetical protein
MATSMGFKKAFNKANTMATSRAVLASGTLTPGRIRAVKKAATARIMILNNRFI